MKRLMLTDGKYFLKIDNAAQPQNYLDLKQIRSDTDDSEYFVCQTRERPSLSGLIELQNHPPLPDLEDGDLEEEQSFDNRNCQISMQLPFYEEKFLCAKESLRSTAEDAGARLVLFCIEQNNEQTNSEAEEIFFELFQPVSNENSKQTSNKDDTLPQLKQGIIALGGKFLHITEANEFEYCINPATSTIFYFEPRFNNLYIQLETLYGIRDALCQNHKEF